MTEGLANRNIVVTGASSGIGKRTCELLLSAGARVIALDRNPLDYAGPRFIAVDLSDQNSIDEAVAQMADTPIDGLCNIAGVPGTAAFETIARVNFLGLRHLTTSLLPSIRRGGSIVNVASVAGSNWRDHMAAYIELAKEQRWDDAEQWLARHDFIQANPYSRFKEALIVWSQAVAGSWMQQHGVRMNCVSPGPVETPIMDDFRKTFGAQNVDGLISMTGRAGTPDDIAPAVVFLLAPEARWICGVNLPVDGGLSAIRATANH